MGCVGIIISFLGTPQVRVLICRLFPNSGMRSMFNNKVLNTSWHAMHGSAGFNMPQSVQNTSDL